MTTTCKLHIHSFSNVDRYGSFIIMGPNFHFDVTRSENIKQQLEIMRWNILCQCFRVIGLFCSLLIPLDSTNNGLAIGWVNEFSVSCFRHFQWYFKVCGGIFRINWKPANSFYFVAIFVDYRFEFHPKENYSNKSFLVSSYEIGKYSFQELKMKLNHLVVTGMANQIRLF